MSFNLPKTSQKRIVIVGGGFAGLKLANKLKDSNLQIVLVDRNNYHQFPPLIYQIASAGIEPSSIVFPFRKMFQKRKDIYYRKAEVRGIFPDKKIIQTSIGKVSYDYLVLAAGTTTNYFGNKTIEENAMPMKNASEAMGLRNALLDNFERALTCASEEERKELLNIVIVGGGATGVEIAGALSEMKKYVFPKDYPDMSADLMHIYLLEASDRLLSAMSQETSQAVKEYLQNMGVDVRLGCFVSGFDDHNVMLKDGTSIPTRTFIWVSGVQAQPIGNLPKEHLGRGGRIKVDAYNRVIGLENVYAIGDQCIMEGTDPDFPQGHPQLAQPAIQQGVLLAENIKRIEAGRTDLKPFRYRNLGSMATVGRNRAVAEFSSIRMKGWFAWIMWLVVHLRSILGVRNKIVVLFNWMWNYFSYGQSLRLIIYAKKAKEVIERERLLQETHWGYDLMEDTNIGRPTHVKKASDTNN